MYAIVYACKRFYENVYGKKVIMYTDHKLLISVMTKELNKIENNQLRRMKTRLAIYNLDVKYIPGCKMVVADCLSRDYIEIKVVMIELWMVQYILLN